MGHFPEHACEHRAFVVLPRVADLAEAERAQRAAMALALADLAADLGDLHFRHLGVVLLPTETAPLRLFRLRRNNLCDRLFNRDRFFDSDWLFGLLARRPLRLLLHRSHNSLLGNDF